MRKVKGKVVVVGNSFDLIIFLLKPQFKLNLLNILGDASVGKTSLL